MRNMSFKLTTESIRNRTKTVTRRLGWWFLKPGDLVMACVQCQGLKKGEKVEKIAPIRIKSTSAVWLDRMKYGDVTREGFPEMRAVDFVMMFCREMHCTPETIVNRIEFEYVDPPPNPPTNGG